MGLGEGDLTSVDGDGGSRIAFDPADQFDRKWTIDEAGPLEVSGEREGIARIGAGRDLELDEAKVARLGVTAQGDEVDRDAAFGRRFGGRFRGDAGIVPAVRKDGHRGDGARGFAPQQFCEGLTEAGLGGRRGKRYIPRDGLVLKRSWKGRNVWISLERGDGFQRAAKTIDGHLIFLAEVSEEAVLGDTQRFLEQFGA
jgi:hypothetical protein